MKINSPLRNPRCLQLLQPFAASDQFQPARGGPPQHQAEDQVNAHRRHRQTAGPQLTPAAQPPTKQPSQHRDDDKPCQNHKSRTSATIMTAPNATTVAYPADATGLGEFQEMVKNFRQPGDSSVKIVNNVVFANTRQPDKRPDEQAIVKPIESPTRQPKTLQRRGGPRERKAPDGTGRANRQQPRDRNTQQTHAHRDDFEPGLAAGGAGVCSLGCRQGALQKSDQPWHPAPRTGPIQAGREHCEQGQQDNGTLTVRPGRFRISCFVGPKKARNNILNV